MAEQFGPSPMDNATCLKPEVRTGKVSSLLVIRNRTAVWTTSKHGGKEPAWKVATPTQVEEKAGWVMERGDGHSRSNGQQVNRLLGICEGTRWGSCLDMAFAPSLLGLCDLGSKLSDFFSRGLTQGHHI